jgi:hypothetical protein
MPTHQRFGTDDRYDLEDRGEPTIELDEEETITAVKLDPALHLAREHDNLLPDKARLRLVIGFERA